MYTTDIQRGNDDPSVRSELAEGTHSENRISSVEIFFSRTREWNKNSSLLKKFISAEEKNRSENIKSNLVRATYIYSHALMRLILSVKLGEDPSEIIFSRDQHNKPILSGAQIHFNLSHTRDAFAFAISRSDYVGIDMESLNRRVDFSSVMKYFFTENDQRFIDHTGNESLYRFILLWTRKESLLKALGVGTRTDLKSFSVSENETADKTPITRNSTLKINCENHFIYSRKIENNMISLAIRGEANVSFNIIDHRNIRGFLSSME